MRSKINKKGKKNEIKTKFRSVPSIELLSQGILVNAIELRVFLMNGLPKVMERGTVISGVG